MANEFKHKTVGTVLTQAEWEATDGTSHQLDSQATGDIIYASSSTVLSRLGIGSTNGFLVVASGLPAWDTSPTVTDDLTFNLGTGNDVVLLNRSSILAANTALSNVMIGTPVTPAVAANSLLVSNVTASGDYLLALNNGGNSQAWHWVDSSAGTQTLFAAGVQRILLNSTGGSFTGTWSDLGTVTTVDINGGSIDGAAIGAASHSTIKGTTIDATTDFTIGSTVITDDDITFGAAADIQTSSGALTLSPTTDVLIENGTGLVVGHTAQITTGVAAEFQVLGTGQVDGTITIGRFSNDAGGPSIDFVKSLNTTIGSNTIVTDDDVLGRLVAYADDGTDYANAAAIFQIEVDDGSPAENDIGTAFVWRAQPGGAGSLREVLRITGSGDLSVPNGDIDMNGTGDLLNVGAAGNDWTTYGLEVRGSYPGREYISVTNELSGNPAATARLSMSVNGSGAGDPYIAFDIAATQIVSLGLDNDADDNFTISDNATLGTNDRLRLVTTTGVLSVDGDGGGSDDPVSLFDDYDDVAELRRYQLAIPGSPITIAERDENRQRLVEMGVGEWAVQESGPDRWMMRVQPLTRLLAGGIYQNRERMVSIEERLAALEAKGG